MNFSGFTVITNRCQQTHFAFDATSTKNKYNSAHMASTTLVDIIRFYIFIFFILYSTNIHNKIQKNTKKAA